MRTTHDTARRIRVRVAQVIALSGVIAMSACEDVTGPEQIETAPAIRLGQSAATDELKSLSESLDDMTGWSLASIQQDSRHGNIVGVLNGLKGHLASGNTRLIQNDLTQAREIISSLTDVQQGEVGPVSVALDVVQLAIGGSQ